MEAGLKVMKQKRDEKNASKARRKRTCIKDQQRFEREKGYWLSCELE